MRCFWDTAIIMEGFRGGLTDTHATKPSRGRGGAAGKHLEGAQERKGGSIFTHTHDLILFQLKIAIISAATDFRFHSQQLPARAMETRDSRNTEAIYLHIESYFK